jgi:hypothetical protein
MSAVKKFGVGVAVALGLVCLGALALWCYFLLTLLHWVAIKIGFSNGLADLLVGVVVVFQSIPILFGIGALVFGGTATKSVHKRVNRW